MGSKRIVHIGRGSWSQNYFNTLKEFPIAVSIAGRDTWKEMVNEQPDGVIVCTPPDTHIKLAKYALERSIPVMIEKPLALSLDEAESLRGYKAPILVNHLYLFSRGYQNFKNGMSEYSVLRVETVGVGTKAHEGYSVLWDYGPHDIAMILDLVGSVPELVFAKDMSFGKGLTFEIEFGFGEIIAHSRIGLAEKRERRIKIHHSQGESIFEDRGDETPRPLHSSIEVFLSAIEGKQDDRLGLKLPLEVIRVLEACERSLLAGGPVAC